MVTYAEQTDKKKAQQSSVNLDKPIETSTPTKVEPTAVAQIAPTPQPTPQTTPVEQKQAPAVTGSYYKDVYLPKVQAQKAKRMWEVQNVEMPAPSKAQTMDVTTLAQAYDIWDVSAIDLENLKQTDPLKYQETKLAIDRKRTLDLINQTAQQQVDTYKQLWESYLKKWDEIAASDEGKTLREEVFAQYWLNESNEKIKKYSNEIDRLDEELEKVNEIWFSADAFADRWRRTTAMRELTKQRNDVAKLRASEIDYYRLWLEQADAVVSDYKEYKSQELAQLWVKFEMMTGMSQMEFQMKDQQNKQYLADVDKQIWVVKSEIATQQELENNIVANTSLLSLYDEFSNENKAAMAQLDPKTLELVLKKVDETNKNSFEKEMKLLWYNLDIEKHNRDMQKYWLESKKAKNITNVNGTMVFSDDYWNVVNTFTPWAIDSSWLDTTQIVDFCTTNRWRSNVQCGELVNDYWKLATGAKMWVENSFSSKVQAIKNKWESQVPVAGGVFAYDVWTYWHTGIITKVNADWSIETLEANIDWTELWSPPVTKKYSAWQYGDRTFSQAPQNNRIIEENAKAMLVGIWGTEWERTEYAKMLVERSNKFWWDLKRAKADLWLITKADQDFIETRKKDIESLKKSTFGDLAQARSTLNMINADNWNGITDTATIVWFLKTIDPSSVARETEVASVQNAVSALWSIEQKLIQAKTGEKLTEKQRTQIKDAMKTIIGAADRKYSDAVLDYVSEFEERGVDYRNYLTTVDMKKVINTPVKVKSNIQYWITDQLEYEWWLYWTRKSEEDYLS